MLPAISLPEKKMDTDTTKLCECTEMLHIRRQAEVCQELFPNEDVAIQPLPSGGIAIRTRAIFQGKLNRAVGCGDAREINEEEVRGLEEFFTASGLTPEIHLGPFASSADFTLLKSRGYEEKGKLTTYWCALGQPDPSPPPHQGGLDACKPEASKVLVRRVESHERERFVEASIAGFSSNGRSRELLGALAEIATRRTDTRLYFAEVDGQVAGTAALASIATDSDGVGVAHLYLDSTLPKYRGQGVQQALILGRLEEARNWGLRLATCITRVGDASGRNAGRVGLRVGYTTSVMGFGKGSRP
ncbi:hypothetical protein N7533_009898 [Penicillium manginii]|jgi:GNAT superfamily N-acetyltransferase|uniref:uncharacterized protein n=1 Tax=Penicillium manginii TaxID=203109 RepID=UPI0025491683|nr:uncharacterized protein N7533_009898 [Penicillium manginii]KAJ5745028.1 hypothetical protein N7533_009898 [Penicillium manginii]